MHKLGSHFLPSRWTMPSWGSSGEGNRREGKGVMSASTAYVLADRSSSPSSGRPERLSSSRGTLETPPNVLCARRATPAPTLSGWCRELMQYLTVRTRSSTCGHATRGARESARAAGFGITKDGTTERGSWTHLDGVRDRVELHERVRDLPLGHEQAVDDGREGAVDARRRVVLLELARRRNERRGALGAEVGRRVRVGWARRLSEDEAAGRRRTRLLGRRLLDECGLRPRLEALLSRQRARRPAADRRPGQGRRNWQPGGAKARARGA